MFKFNPGEHRQAISTPLIDPAEHRQYISTPLIGVDFQNLVFSVPRLQNLVNEIDIANIQAQANFKGDGAGSNHVKTLNGQAGSVLNFSQLQNLANSHIGNFDGNGRVDFRGGGHGMHTIDNARGNKGSHFVFAI